jgi:hypothetical protein
MAASATRRRRLAVFIAFSWLMRQALSPGAAARGYLFLAVEFRERRGELAMIQKMWDGC